MARQNAVVTGYGFYVPPRVVTNREFEQMNIETTDEKIVQLTGIRERRFVADGETTSTMATRAARAAIERARLRPHEIDLIIVGTCSPDYLFPATACLVQRDLGADRAGAFDVEAACTSFVSGVAIANGMILAGTHRNAVVIGAECLSRLLDFRDRSTCVLFGDGAGAVVLEASNASVGVESAVLHSDGSKGELLWVEAGASRVPASADTLAAGKHFIRMQGRETFKLAVKSMADAAEEALVQANVTADEIDLMIPHQANIRIIQGVADRLSFPMDKVFVNLQRYGNTSAASIPIALAEAAESGRLKKGDRVLLAAFGGGFTWGASVMEWWGVPVPDRREKTIVERAARTAEDLLDKVLPGA